MGPVVREYLTTLLVAIPGALLLIYASGMAPDLDVLLPWYVWVVLGCVLISGLGPVMLWVWHRRARLEEKKKGQALRNATVKIHSLRPTTPPSAPASREEQGVWDAARAADRSQGPLSYYELDVTIIPWPATGRPAGWVPDELYLVSCEAEGDCEETALVLTVTVAGAAQPDQEGEEVLGSQRLRLLIGVRPGVRRLVFEYFGERFGEVLLMGAGP
jgi:hypothetical protein